MTKLNIFITGGSTGLGLALATALGKEHQIYATYFDKKPAEAIRGIKFVELDITNVPQVKKAISGLPDIDVLVNCAGLTFAGGFSASTPEQFEKLLAVNAIAPLRFINYFVPKMQKQGRGLIINVTSLNGLLPTKNFSIYSASKHALEALGIAIHYELAGTPVSIVNVAPGAIYRPAVSANFRPLRDKFPILKTLLPITTQDVVVEKIVDLVNSKWTSLPSRILVGSDTKVSYLLSRYLPYSWFDSLMLKLWRQ